MNAKKRSESRINRRTVPRHTRLKLWVKSAGREVGGDADTLAAIIGAIAEARHGIPDELKGHAEGRYLAEVSHMLEVLHEVY